MTVALEGLIGKLPRYGRLIGIDLGTKTIGLALSDVERRIASPLETLKRGKFTRDAAEIARIVTRFDVAAIVVGLPLNMDGSAGPRAQSTQSFMRNLEGVIACPIVGWDERLSTMAVTRTLLEADASRARRGQLVDKLAASYILQGAIDRLNLLEDARTQEADRAADQATNVDGEDPDRE
ncbi:MAG: putative holliday junction resolvase [Saliniramus fredricksonii]|uniref:Putative pre-16S rRNA nuclease n=1 Tax=Saliniramus fredricksonii TaxID=1653334 RepID=A0A0N8KET6_9HYPH|nr:Holliday junction resolvase RuvX [Saliniramus fredricksonii]KPQ12242.1 MAG: putative holliday junction resolvase [Saliniramus fredricksonii]SCC78933.1 putative holliday junction resolvase [Saliniramus fredricksonii]